MLIGARIRILERMAFDDSDGAGISWKDLHFQQSGRQFDGSATQGGVKFVL
ncbi:MAG: hypothetical protein IPJ00_10950 [Saprospirales bacterium]|nr:hypothetical protein [Saprospirales bacterium]